MAVQLALAFGAVLVAGLLISAAIRNRSLGDILKGVTSPNESQASSEGFGISGHAGSAFKGFKRGRVDQGVDFSAKPGTPILTPYKAKVIGIRQNWYRGQPFVFFKFLEGPLKGKLEYVAEQISPTVKPGQEVEAGGQIGVYAQTGTGIERGFATESGETLAASTTGYAEGQETRAGKEYLSQVYEATNVGAEHSMADAIRKFFEGKGLSRAQAAGIVGNLRQESGLNPSAAGGGLDQGQGSRAIAGSLAQQLQGIWNELQGSEHNALDALRRAHGPAQAARVFSRLFERPGIPMISNRERYAEEAYAGVG